ncbi:MAG: lysine transporter LysE [Sneathiella sp.]|jgi:threonine/homoserine/homoserine lactone efflux protein|uniref:LysE family translocator n=1 Tax=Sneathiella sp. TaxID=1964365 RepID=UPI000C52EAA7|nr:LysE family translocator [Sneathiella sp.]MAL78027.1 lysine transporter LysE [Sneathiella sp.]
MLMDPGKMAVIALFAFSMVASPGPVNMLLMASGANFGFRRSLPFLLGCISGFLLVCLATALGLGTLFTTSPVLQLVFLGVSLLYILYLAYRIATSNPEIVESADRPGYLAGLILHPLNPKAWVAVIAAYSQFISPDTDYTTQVIVIIVIFTLIGLPFNSLWCYGGNLLRRLVTAPRLMRLINVTLALLMLVAVGIALMQADFIAPLRAAGMQ